MELAKELAQQERPVRVDHAQLVEHDVLGDDHDVERQQHRRDHAAEEDPPPREGDPRERVGRHRARQGDPDDGGHYVSIAFEAIRLFRGLWRV